jgi:hypothetical protein
MFGTDVPLLSVLRSHDVVFTVLQSSLCMLCHRTV